MRHSLERLGLLSILLALALAACTHAPPQAGDLSYEPVVERPTYAAAASPQVLIDEAHCNFHTAEGRYKPFADLLRGDGLVVEPLDAAFSAESLAGADVLVIANALGEAQCERWKLPTASAFRNDEIEALAVWVEEGGALLLIADHMPFPGANEKLARAFGLVFIDGYARPDEGGSRIAFERATGTLGDHPITEGRSGDERIESVTSFTGQGFRSLDDDIVPLMTLPAGTTMHMTREAGEFEDDTARFSAEGLLQGAVFIHGKGRVAVFGEAAMFSAQEIHRDGNIIKFGMNADGAEDNPQFLLNVMHWLTGLLDE